MELDFQLDTHNSLSRQQQIDLKNQFAYVLKNSGFYQKKFKNFSFIDGKTYSVCCDYTAEPLHNIFDYKQFPHPKSPLQSVGRTDIFFKQASHNFFQRGH